MITIELFGRRARIENGRWDADEPRLRALLDSFLDPPPGADAADPDLAICLRILQRYPRQAAIIGGIKRPDFDPRRVY